MHYMTLQPPAAAASVATSDSSSPRCANVGSAPATQSSHASYSQVRQWCGCDPGTEASTTC
jgi:hypothetical protein